MWAGSKEEERQFRANSLPSNTGMKSSFRNGLIMTLSLIFGKLERNSPKTKILLNLRVKLVEPVVQRRCSLSMI